MFRCEVLNSTINSDPALYNLVVKLQARVRGLLVRCRCAR
jgi:hypothetical protein